MTKSLLPCAQNGAHGGALSISQSLLGDIKLGCNKNTFYAALDENGFRSSFVNKEWQI